MREYDAMSEANYPVIDDYYWNTNSYVNYGPGNYPILDDGFDTIVPLDREQSWFKNSWRPAIAWQYFAVCLFDFIIAPILTIGYFYYVSGAYEQWQPLTLVAGGF